MITQTGDVLWLYQEDFQNFNLLDKISALFTGVKPLHSQAGLIYLKEDRICLESESDDLEIRLEDITQLYLGFDEYYQRAYAKNFGTVWQPLKLTFTTFDSDNSVIYLVIDYNQLSTNNKLWFELLQDRLS
jgi:hypothetical protein